MTNWTLPHFSACSRSEISCINDSTWIHNFKLRMLTYLLRDFLKYSLHFIMAFWLTRYHCTIDWDTDLSPYSFTICIANVISVSPFSIFNVFSCAESFGKICANRSFCSFAIAFAYQWLVTVTKCLVLGNLIVSKLKKKIVSNSYSLSWKSLFLGLYFTMNVIIHWITFPT